MPDATPRSALFRFAAALAIQQFTTPDRRSTMPCAHEDLTMLCCFGCPEGTVDSDTFVCSSCKEPVCPTWNCAYCDEQIGEGFERPVRGERVPEVEVKREIPPHTHTWVSDGRYSDTGDWREVCTTCPAIRSLRPAELEVEPNDLAGETQQEWTRRMGAY